jgi:hypothetical protein
MCVLGHDAKKVHIDININSPLAGTWDKRVNI